MILLDVLGDTSQVVARDRRDGRVVDYTGLENRRTERYRGFESLSLRNEALQAKRLQGSVLCFKVVFLNNVTSSL